MYIEPNSDIRLLTGVKLDSSYENTIFFDSLTDQTNYFIAKTRHNLTDQYFQRVTKGVARVQIPIGQLYDCSYMMFRNTSFLNKWFYAFIDNVEYINNAVSEIHFTLDVIQTWFFDYNLQQCFIERCHSSTDGIGDNITPEPVELGEIIYNNYGRLIPIGSEHNLITYVIIVAINDVSGGPAFSGRYDGVLSGSELWAFRSSDVSSVEAKIQDYIQRPEAVTALYMIPQAILGYQPDIGGVSITAKAASGSDPKPDKRGAVFQAVLPEAMWVDLSSTLDGYTPKNKKLLTYPFNYLEVITGSGNNLGLRYEFFDGVPQFTINGTISMPVAVSLRPSNYKNCGESSLAISDEQLTLNNYPMGSWLNDAYEAWIAQNSVLQGGKLLTSLGGVGVAGALVGARLVANPIGLIGAGVAAVGTVANILMGDYKASIAADQTHGNSSPGNINYSNTTQDFFCGRRSVNKYYAKIIDDFFSMYGYAQNIIGHLNRKTRPHWCYIKTVGCQGSGAVPNEDAVKINDLYNRGIRFWTNGDNIGNYSLNNAP